MSDRILRSHTLWRILICTVVMFAYFSRVATKVAGTGDQPHYLLGALSLVKDGDFNVFNNYANQDYKEFGIDDLRPQHPESRPGVLITEHGIGFPALLAIPWKLRKLSGVHAYLFMTGLLTMFVVGRCCDLLYQNAWPGTLATFLVGFCPTWLLHSRLIFPECTAGLASVVISVLLLRLSLHSAQRERVRPFLLGLFFFVPLLYVRYIPLIVPLYAMIPFSPVLRRMQWLYAGFVCGLIGSIAVWLRFPEPGSIGATNFAAQGSQFLLSGAFDRLWRSWFDRSHGLVVYSPWVVLVFWAALYCLPRLRPLRVGYIESAALATLGYCLMFGPWVQEPGTSVPGRYLCSAVPLMSILVVHWCYRANSLWNARTALAVALLSISVVIVLVSIWAAEPTYFLFPKYSRIFQHYWPSPWYPAQIVSSRPVGVLIITVLIASKLGPLLLSNLRNREEVVARAGR